jgi:hypothetical protein
MKNIKYTIGIILLILVIIAGCQEETYEFGDLVAPSNLVINADIVGLSDENPNGDGSGEVTVTVNAQNAITYHIGFNKLAGFGNVSYSVLPSGTIAKKFTDPGVNTYRISVIAFGKGGISSNLTKDITVRFDYVADPEIVTALTNDDSKTWVVDKSVPGHIGVGPWASNSVSPEWWAAGIDEKVGSADCFYTSEFIFTKVIASDTYTLKVVSPDGAFTKTGDLAGGLPGIPASGDEGCYPYSGGTSAFNFVPSSSGTAADVSTKAAIQIDGFDTFIGYGATQQEYEILEINADYMYLRVQGTEPGNAWYVKLKPVE